MVVLAGAAYYLVLVAAPHWPAIRSRDLAWRVSPLAASGVLVLATLAILLAAWTASLHWCGAQLRYRDAARIWFTANLARFIPGTVWQFASLAAMASRYQVSMVAATATVLLEQVVLLITGLLVIAVFAPAGLLVREAALIGLLSPLLGSGDAVILAAASRLWLTALEVLAAIVVLALPTLPEAP